MEQTRYASRFRYLDAGDLDDGTIDLDDLEIHNDAGDTIGEAEGFVVDARTGRPYYLVVDSGGWFSGGQYLLPIGYVRLDRDEDGDPVLRANLDKATIQRFPEFDRDRFAALPEDQQRQYEQSVIDACGGTGARALRSNASWDYERWDDYRQPEWWHTRPVTADREPARSTWVAGDAAIPSSEAEPVSERERLRMREEPARAVPGGDRAQPGDVLGIENEGATTTLGDTAEDEEERLEDEEEAARKRRD